MSLLASIGAVRFTAGLGTGHATTTTHDLYIPEVWSKKVQAGVEANLVFGKSCMRWDDAYDYGDVINIPIFSNFTAKDKSASTAVTFANTSNEDDVNVSINKHKYVAFLLEDVLKQKAGNYNIANLMKDKGIYGVSKAMDYDLATLVASMTQTVGTYDSDAAGDADITRAIQYLDDADAPMTDRSFIFKPVIAKALRDNSKFVAYDQVGEKRIVTGLMGQIYGLVCKMSTNVYTSGDHNANVIMHREAMLLAPTKLYKTVQGYVIEYLSEGIITHMVYGVSAYRSTFGVNFKS